MALVEESFIAASGPGGQNVNKVATAVQLRLDVYALRLPPAVFHRLKDLAGSRMTAGGEIIITARRFRAQEQNRADARERLAELLEKALVESFGSVDEFKAQFAAAGAGQFGSGWCWLVKNADGSLAVTKTENGVNPLCFGQTALLGCDVWEHSYYIDFRNKRPAYLDNFLNKLVNWENVAARLAG